MSSRTAHVIEGAVIGVVAGNALARWPRLRYVAAIICLLLAAYFVVAGIHFGEAAGSLVYALVLAGIAALFIRSGCKGIAKMKLNRTPGWMAALPTGQAVPSGPDVSFKITSVVPDEATVRSDAARTWATAILELENGHTHSALLESDGRQVRWQAAPAGSC